MNSDSRYNFSRFSLEKPLELTSFHQNTQEVELILILSQYVFK